MLSRLEWFRMVIEATQIRANAECGHTSGLCKRLHRFRNNKVGIQSASRVEGPKDDGPIIGTQQASLTCKTAATKACRQVAAEALTESSTTSSSVSSLSRSSTSPAMSVFSCASSASRPGSAAVRANSEYRSGDPATASSRLTAYSPRDRIVYQTLAGIIHIAYILSVAETREDGIDLRQSPTQ